MRAGGGAWDLRTWEADTIDRLKVLFITEWYPTAVQPVAGIFVREHAQAVAIYDDVVVLHPMAKDPALPEARRLVRDTDATLTAGLPTYRLQRRPARLPGLSSVGYIQGVMAAVHELMACGFRPDVIHAHIYEAGVPAVMIGAREHIPVVITEHTSAFPRRLLPPWQVWKARYAFGRADRVLPVSRALQGGIERYGIQAKFTIVPNAVDTTIFHPPAHLAREPGPLRLLFVGGLTPVKGLPTLFEALTRVQWSHAGWRLDVVGDGIQRVAYEQQVAELGLGDQIAFHGLQPKAVVADFMQRADLFILPSLWDNAPCVLIEAMACGLPILATQVGGIPEIVDEAVGRLAPPDDSAALADALARMLNILPSYDRRDIAARATRYSPTEVGRALHAIYAECLRR